MSRPQIAANIDTSKSMASFLKEVKILNELSKGVASLKTFVYPSVLQKEAIPVLKTKKNANVILRYSSMSGVKLTVLLPVLNHLIREVASGADEDTHYLGILCHSARRCAEYEAFIKGLLGFCTDVVDLVGFYSGDKAENALAIKKAMARTAGEAQAKQAIKDRCKVFVATPNHFLDYVLP